MRGAKKAGASTIRRWRPQLDYSHLRGLKADSAIYSKGAGLAELATAKRTELAELAADGANLTELAADTTDTELTKLAADLAELTKLATNLPELAELATNLPELAERTVGAKGSERSPELANVSGETADVAAERADVPS